MLAVTITNLVDEKMSGFGAVEDLGLGDLNGFPHDMKKERQDCEIVQDGGPKLVTKMDMDEVEEQIRKMIIDTMTEPEEGDRPYKRLLGTRIIDFMRAFRLRKRYFGMKNDDAGVSG